nr:ParA family protein [Desulfobacula sp.]
MSTILTISGQRGGTGKSVTAVNLASSLALLEKNTLLIDTDPQGSATHWCGIRQTDYAGDLASVLSARVKFTDAVVRTEFKYLDIMPSGFNLVQVAAGLAKHSENEKLLRLFLTDVEKDYDYIIIDPPSSYGFLSMMAITAADRLLICMPIPQTRAEDFPDLLRCVKYIKTRHQIPLKIAGLLFTRCESKEARLSFIRSRGLSDANRLIFNTFIPEDDKIEEVINMKIPAALHDIKGPAASAYLNLAREVHSFFNKKGAI